MYGPAVPVPYSCFSTIEAAQRSAAQAAAMEGISFTGNCTYPGWIIEDRALQLERCSSCEKQSRHLGPSGSLLEYHFHRNDNTQEKWSDLRRGNIGSLAQPQLKLEDGAHSAEFKGKWQINRSMLIQFTALVIMDISVALRELQWCRRAHVGSTAMGTATLVVLAEPWRTRCLTEPLREV